MRHHDQDATRQGSDLTRAAGAGKARARTGVIADHGCVQVAKAVDLRPTQKAEVNKAALEVVLENLGHRANAQSAGDQCWVADGEGRPVRAGANGAGLVDENQARAARAAGEIYGNIGNADADKDDLIVAQHAGRGGDHDLVGGEFRGHQ